MSRFRIIPVFILTRDRRTGFALKNYLEDHSRFSFPVVAEVYLNPGELLPHLSLYDTNFIVVDYNEHFLEQLNEILDQPGNMVYDTEILLRSPSEHYISAGGVSGKEVIDQHDFPAVAESILMLLRKEKKEKGFLEANYMLAGLLMLIAIITAIVVI